MAIEIIPKPKIKKVPWPRIVLAVVLVLFLIFLLSYSVLIFYQTKLNRELSELEKKLRRTQAEEDLKKNLLASQKLIEDWKLIATGHSLALGAFEFLEKNSHPQAWFSDFKLELNQGVMDIKGQTDSFETLGQQLLIFEKQELIKKTTLSKVSMDKEGKIIFDLRLDLDPKIFSPDLFQKIK